jgi:predicted ATPase
VALWLLGYPDQAVQRSNDAVALGRELGQPGSLALALHFAAVLRQYRREVLAVQASAEAATGVTTEYGLSFWLAGSLVLRGWAQAEQGVWAGGIALLRRGMTDWVATGSESNRTYFLALLAEALGKGGQVDEGLGVLAEALALGERTGESFHEAELYRLKGEFLLRQGVATGALPGAEACFRQALAVARRQQAKSLELRATISLARLYRQQDRLAEAQPLLAECYGWFTEGFETHDLQEAKELLEWGSELY